MAAFGSLTLSWPGVWAHHGCCLTRSANSDIPTLSNLQPVPQSLLLTMRRHFIASFWKTQAITGGVPVNFLTFVPTNFETPWVPFCSKFKLRFHLDAFGDHEHCAPAGRSHAKRCCVKTDTTRFQTAPWQELYCPRLDIPWPPLLHQRCLWMLCTRSEMWRQGWRVESTKGVWQCQKNRCKAKMNQTESNNESCGCIWPCMHRCTNLWLDTGFVCFSYTIRVVYSFIILIPFGRLFLHFWQWVCRFLVVHRSPTHWNKLWCRVGWER